MTLNRKDLEKMSGKLKSMEFDENNIDLQKDASTQLTEKIAKETGLSIEDVLSLNNVVDDENKESRADVKNQQTEKIKVLKQKQIEAMKKKIESKEVPDHIAKIHFSSQEDFRKKFLEYFVGENNPELVKQYESADELKDLFESKFEDAERKHVGIVANEITPEASQLVNDFQLPEELLVEDFTEEQFLDKLKEHLRTKGSTKLKDELKEHNDLIDKIFAKDVMKGAARSRFEDYEKKHVGALERKLTPEIIEALEKFEITDAMAEEHMGASDFNKKMRSVLIEGNKKLKEVLSEHPELAEKIFENNDYRDKEEEKYEAYEKKHSNIISKKIGDSIATEIDALEIPQEFLDQEMSPEEFQNKLFNNLASKNRELQKEMREHPNLGLDKLTRQQESVKNSLQKKQESLENQKTELTKTEILAEINAMKFTPAEIGNESLHKDQNAFAEAFKGRFSPGLLNKIQKRGSKINSFLQEQLKTTLYSRWENEHEKAEKEEKKGELLKAAQRNPLPVEWSSEDMDESQFIQKYFDSLADADEELRDPKHQTLRNELFRDPELQTSLKKRFKNFLEQRGDRLLEKTKEDLRNIKYSPEETREDAFHNKPNDFAQFVLKNKISPETKALLDKLPPEKRAEIEGKLFQHAKEELYGNWLKDHEAAEKQDAKSAFIQLIRDYKETHTPVGMKDEFGSEEDFKKAMWLAVVANSPNKEWQEDEHASMIDALSKDAEVNGALNERYAFYKEKFKEVAQDEINESLKAIADGFSLEDIDNDDYHKNRQRFSAEMMKRLPQKLRRKMASLADLEAFAQKQFENNLYDSWEKKHETAEEKKFTQELEEKILGQEMPPDFANGHYENKDFQSKWFELIKNGLSDDLKGEHAEVLERLLGKDRIQNAFRKKFEAYEEAHDKAMEEKFSQELAMLNLSTAMPPEMIQKQFTPEGFKSEWFSRLIQFASPELQEELTEHAGLREKLFAQQRVQVGLEQNHKKYESEHEKFTMTKYSQEVTASIKSEKIPPEMFKTPPTEAQFSSEIMARIFKNANPELQKNTSLQSKLLNDTAVKNELIRKYQEFKKSTPETPKKAKEEALSAEIAKLQKDGKIPAEAANLELLDTWDEEQVETMLSKLSPAVRAHFSKLVSAKRPGKMEMKILEKSSEEKQQKAQVEFEREVERLKKTGDLPEGAGKESLDQLSREELEKVLEKADPTIKKNILAHHEERKAEKGFKAGDRKVDSEKQKDSEKFSSTAGHRPSKSLEQKDEKEGMKKKFAKIDPERDISLDGEFQGDLDEVLNEDVGRSRMNMMMKSFALRKLMEKSHRKRLFEKFFMQWSAQLKESDFNLFKLKATRKNTTLEEAFALMFKTPQRRLAVSRIRKFSPKVWQKFNQGLKYTTMKSSDLLASRAPKKDEKVKVMEEEVLMENLQTVKLSAQTEQQEESMIETPEEELTTASDEATLLQQNDEDLGQEEEGLEEKESSLDLADHEEEEMLSEEDAEVELVPVEEEETEVQNLQILEEDEDQKEETDVLQDLQEEEETAENKSAPNFDVAEQDLQPSILHPTLEKRNTVSITRNLEKTEKPTDPLKELEKFRKQLMLQLRRGAQMAQMQKTFDLMGINIEPFYEIANEESSEFLESLRMEMEENSMSLGSLLKKFVRYIRFISDFEIPAHYSLSSDLQERLLSNPAEVFKALNDHYFVCREHHERSTELTFSAPGNQEGDLNLVFEVHKNEVPETCAAFVFCKFFPYRKQYIAA